MDKKSKSNSLLRFFKSKKWRMIVGVLALVVAIVTVSVLVLPGVAMAKCGIEEHTHTEDCYENLSQVCSLKSLGIHEHTEACYDDENVLTCGYTDYVIHSHTELCYDEDEKLICTLVEQEPHIHTEECYELADVTVEESHTHTADCYEITTELTCGEEESDSHTHVDSCYTELIGDIICGYTEGEPVTEEQNVITCGLYELHTHTDDCNDEDGKRVCGIPELTEHNHTEACMEPSMQNVLVCTKEEHTHSDDCLKVEEGSVEDEQTPTEADKAAYENPEDDDPADTEPTEEDAQPITKDGKDLAKVGADAGSEVGADKSDLSKSSVEGTFGSDGKTFTDTSGIVYSIDKTAKTAKVTSVPSDMKKPVIPATVSPDLYKVTGVGSKAFSSANPESIYFVKPAQIKTVDSQAFANCSNLFSVNNRTTIAEIKKLFANAVFPDDAFRNTKLDGDVQKTSFSESDPKGKASVDSKLGNGTLSLTSPSNTSMYKEGSKGGYYKLLTGQVLNLRLSAQPVVTERKEYRIYVDTTSSDATLFLKSGDTFTVNGVTLTGHSTPVAGVCYYSFTLNDDQTVSVDMPHYYINGSAGGGMRFWTAMVDPGEGETYIAPSADVIEAWWGTQRTEYKVSKTSVAPNVYLKNDGTYPDFSSKLAWNVNMTRDETVGGQTNGKDVVSYYEVTDTITLPKGIRWKQEILDYVKAGNANITYYSGYNFIAIQIRGSFRSETGAYVSRSDIVLKNSSDTELAANFKNIAALEVDSNNNLVLKYKVTNTSDVQELKPFSFIMELNTGFGSGAATEVEASPFEFGNFDELKSEISATNNIKITYHYNYSDDKTVSAKDDVKITLNKGQLDFTKSISRYTYQDTTFGDTTTYNLVVKNVGSTSVNVEKKASTGNYLVDDLDPMYYLTDTEMLRLLYADYADNLTVYIDNATFVNNLDGYREVTNLNGKTSKLIPANENSAVTKKDVEIRRTGDSILIDIEGDEYTVTKSQFTNKLKELGYCVVNSNDTVYAVEWNIYNIAPKLTGYQTLNFTINAASRSTYERNTIDSIPYNYIPEEKQIPNSASMYINGNYTTRAASSRTFKTDSHFYLYAKLSDDTTYRKGGYYPSIGDVMNYRMDYDSYGGQKALETMPLAAYLEGAQMAIAPVSENPELASAGLEKRTVNDVEYYVFNKAGTYKNVKIGKNAEKGTGYYTAAAINVNPDVLTTVTWYKNNASTNGATFRIYFDSVIGPSDPNTTQKSFSMNTYAYANARQTDHLSDVIGNTPVGMLKTEKDIYYPDPSDPANPTKGTIDDDKTSTVKSGDTVTYRLTLKNLLSGKLTISGADIRDQLPDTKGAFAWKKGVNVTLTASMAEGNTSDAAMTDLAEGYSIYEGRIRWKRAHSITLGAYDTAYILVTLTYPSGQDFNDYYTLVGGERLVNTLTVLDQDAMAYHYLSQETSAKLIKGVYDVGTTDTRTYVSESGQQVLTGFTYTSSNDNYSYSDSTDYSDGFVIYYISLVNDGSAPLYLTDEIVDSSLLWNQQSGAYSPRLIKQINSNDVKMFTDWDEGEAFTDFNLLSDSSVQPVSADVEVRKFNNNTSNGNYAFKLELTGEYRNQKSGEDIYYLLPNQCVQLAYVAKIPAGYQNAMLYSNLKNTASMYTNPSYNDVKLSEKDYAGLRSNCDEEPDLKNNTFSSEVTLKPGKPVPGITKKMKGYNIGGGEMVTGTHNAPVGSTVYWNVRVENLGSEAMRNYRLVDEMQYPFSFGDTITVKQYDRNDTLLTTRVYTKSYQSNTEGGGSYVWTETSVKGKYAAPSTKSVKFTLDDSGKNQSLSYLCYLQTVGLNYGAYMEIDYTTTNNTSVVEAGAFTNTATLTPLYDKLNQITEISNGIPVKDSTGKLIGVTASDTVNVHSGIYTEAIKGVAEVGNSSNSAISTDTVPYIVLQENENTDKPNEFTYAVQVTAPENNAIEKLVLIDTLPYVGDHNPFVDSLARGSEFAVKLSDTPEFAAYVIDKDGNTSELSSADYVVELSTQTEMTAEDWKGRGSDTGSKWKQSVKLDRVRSIRITLMNVDHSVLPAGSTVQFRCNARVEDNYKPDGIAWNSFGYHYTCYADTAKTTLIELEALPQPVGVIARSVPAVRKDISYSDGTAYSAEKDETFTFMIHQGKALSTYDSFTEMKAGTPVWFVNVTVPKGTSTSDYIKLNPKTLSQNAYTLSDPQTGKFTKANEAFKWTDSSSYTVVEINYDDLSSNEIIPKPFTENGSFRFGSIGNDSENKHTFTYKSDSGKDVIAVNTAADATPELPKTGGIGLLPTILLGAFALLASGAGILFINKRRKKRLTR